MLFLTTTDKIEAFLDINTTNTVSYYANYMDTTGDDPKKSAGYINGTTDTDIIAAPAADQRLIKYLNIYNGHTVPVVVTIQLDVSGTEYVLYKVSLAVGQSLYYTPETGFFLSKDVVLGYSLLVDEQSSGTSGGTTVGITGGTWGKRRFSAISIDLSGLVLSLSSDVFVLTAGTYETMIFVPGYACDAHQARLYNTSDAQLVLLGTNAYASNAVAVSNHSVICGRFTIGASKNLEVQMTAGTGYAHGRGLALSIGTESYTRAEFRRVG